MITIAVLLLWATPVAIGVFTVWDIGMVNPAMWQPPVRAFYGVWSAGCFGLIVFVALPEDIRQIRKVLRGRHQ
jgi:hypothetical protein